MRDEIGFSEDKLELSSRLSVLADVCLPKQPQRGGQESTTVMVGYEFIRLEFVFEDTASQ